MNSKETEVEQRIIEILSTKDCTINELCTMLYAEGFSERLTKEAVLRMRESGRIKPNKRWEMMIADVMGDSQ